MNKMLGNAFLVKEILSFFFDTTVFKYFGVVCVINKSKMQCEYLDRVGLSLSALVLAFSMITYRQ